MPNAVTNPKQIEDPENEGQMIDNPDYDSTKNEDGSDIEVKDDLAPIKEKLNSAYGERDRLKSELAEAKKKIRDAELEQLKNEGKEKEHFEGVIEDLKKESSDKDDVIADLKDQIVALTRDNQVQKYLSGFTFKNDRAQNLAVQTVTDDLVQDEKGKWVAKNGKSIKDFVKEFAEDEDNEFLFKPKENRGTGKQPGAKPGEKTNAGTSLFDLPQSEVLRMASEGKLPARK